MIIALEEQSLPELHDFVCCCVHGYFDYSALFFIKRFCTFGTTFVVFEQSSGADGEFECTCLFENLVVNSFERR